MLVKYEALNHAHRKTTEARVVTRTHFYCNSSIESKKGFDKYKHYAYAQTASEYPSCPPPSTRKQNGGRQEVRKESGDGAPAEAPIRTWKTKRRLSLFTRGLTSNTASFFLARFYFIFYNIGRILLKK